MLEEKDVEKSLLEIRRMPPRQAVNPLFSFLYSTDELIRWHAVSAMGETVCTLAETDLEAARVIIRRLMWNLNEESGGIGWGSAEAMGEICARNEHLGAEYAKMLISYIDPQQNFIENERLQQGVLWGIGRLSHARPERVKYAARHLAPFLSSPDPILRGLSAWGAAPLKDGTTDPLLKALSNDHTEITIYLDHRLVTCTLSSLFRGRS
ncbi:MAG: HEAT repeat domain-containing protein [Pseudomonadota bacterium]